MRMSTQKEDESMVVLPAPARNILPFGNAYVYDLHSRRDFESICPEKFSDK